MSTVPSAPLGVSAIGGDSQAIVSWLTPANGGSPITGYTVKASGGATEAATGSPHVFTGVSNPSTHTFTVLATNTNGDSAYSAPSNSVNVKAAAPPDPVTNVAVVAGNGQVVVSFAPPLNDGRSPILGYVVVDPYTGLGATGPGSPIVVTGLTNGQDYAFNVLAYNAAGTSVETDAPFAMPQANVPDAPSGVAAIPGNGQASVSFGAPDDNGGSTILFYTATSSPGGFQGAGFDPTQPIIVAGLANGTPYTFTVTATNAVGAGTASDASASVIPATTADSPTGITATASNGQAVVSFTPPVNSGGSPVTGYIVTANPPDVAPFAGASSPITIPGLTNGHAYVFTVRSVNSIGVGAQSEPSNSVTPQPLVPGIPASPTAVLATASNGVARVMWGAPIDDGGSAITEYIITASPPDVAPVIGSNRPTYPFGLMAIVTGLINGTAYTFTVQAVNVTGSGAPSTPSNEVTPEPLVPTAPFEVVAVAGDSQAWVSFEPCDNDGGSPVTGYVATASPGGMTGTATGATVIVPGLNNGTAYTFTVNTVNAVGESPPSLPSNSVTPVRQIIGNSTGAAYAGAISFPGAVEESVAVPVAGTPNLLNVPLDNSPNQSMSVDLFIDGQNLTLDLMFRWNDEAGYWLMGIADNAGNSLVDGIPLLRGFYPAANLLAQYAYLQIGSVYVVPVAKTPLDSPDVDTLGTTFLLIWGDTP